MRDPIRCSGCDGEIFDEFEKIVLIDHDPYHKDCAITELINYKYIHDVYDKDDLIKAFENTEITTAIDYKEVAEYGES